MVFARSAAMAFNRLVDARLDAANPRTATRHLPAGRMTRWQVSLFTIFCGLGFVASTALFLPNRLPLLLSLPVLLFLCGYSFAKRFTAAAHLWLGVALSLSPLCAWIAIRGATSMAQPEDLLAPLILAAAVAAWVTGFDLLYACQDAEYDASVGLHSIPAKLGVRRALKLALICHLVMLILLVILPVLVPELGLGLLYWGAWVVVAGLVLRQHSLVRPDDLQRVNQAFFDTNAAISLVLLVAGTVDTLWV
jgi:4-hydroxybenzoate polyprenyltransferase